MKKNILSIIKISIIASLTFGMVACTDGFGSMNTDPNYPTNVTPELLLNPLLRTLIRGQFDYGDGPGLAHHIARTNYNEVEQYYFSSKSGDWSGYYTQLNNIEEMARISDLKSLPSSKAIAYILKAFVAAQLTDMWRDVPYTEATKGAENTTPKYDSQETIYTGEGGIIDLLKQADEILSQETDNMPNDLVYSGDRTKWRKLANSIRLRYLMRISNRIVDAKIDIKKEIADVVTKPLMEDNSDNMLLPFLSGNPNRCPIYNERAGSFEYLRMSDEMQSMWDKYADPRVPVWFAPTFASVPTGKLQYKGIPVGCSATTLKDINYNAADVSLFGDYYRAAPDKCSAILMNCSEVKFLLAEAYKRGYANGDAKIAYEDGVKLSLEYYGVDNKYTDYMAQNGIAYNEVNAIEQIMTQKWMSLFFIGYQAWFEYVRTGLPKQEPLRDNRNPSGMGGRPSRFYYPEDEQAVNGNSLKDALSRMGGKDDVNYKLWWE